MMYALTCGIPPSSVVEVFSTVMNNSGNKLYIGLDIGILADLMQRYQLLENPKIPISGQHYYCISLKL